MSAEAGPVPTSPDPSAPGSSARLTWDDGVALAAAQSGAVVLVGATDVGKSTFALAAANAAVREGRKAAILDTDIGQSEVGPPGTLGAVRLEEPVASLTELRPRALAFVGDISPMGHLLSLVQGSHRLLEHCRDRGDELVLVDTPGLVSGRVAEKLKLAELSLLQPSLVLCLQRGREMERLVQLARDASRCPVAVVQSPPEARRKSPVYRRMRRANRMRRHMEGARIQELDASRVRVVDAWIYTGAALPARKLQVASAALKTPVVHGEETADGIYLCVTGRPDRGGFVVLQEEFNRKRVTLTPATAFHHLLVGLIGPGGYVVDVGLLQGVNFERAILSILTPARTTADVVQLHFGRVRVRPDGSEIARLRPADL